MTKPTRVTVPVDPEVLEVFKRLSGATGVSVGKAMGDWLLDTSEAAIAMADLMEKARQQPKLVVQQLHGYALGLQDLTTELLDDIRKKKAVTPPVSNTGGKLPQTQKKVGGANAKKRD